NHVVWVGCAAALAVDSPTGWNRNAIPARYLYFSERHRAGGHVNHDGWLLLTGKCDGDRVGAEHALRAPQRGDQFGCVGHRPSDQVVLEGFKNIVAGDPEMIGVAHAHPSGAAFLRHLHGDAIRVRTDYES